MYHAIFNIRGWILCVLACLFTVGNVEAQTVTSTYKTASASTTMTVTLVEVGPPKEGMTLETRDITYRWVARSKVTSGTGAILSATCTGGLVASWGSSTQPAFGQGLVKKVNAALTMVNVGGVTKYRGGMSLSDGSPTVYFYADIILEVAFNLPGGTNGSRYMIYQGSNLVETVDIAPDDVFLWKRTTSDDTPFYVHRQGATKDLIDGFWYFTPGEKEPTAAGSGTPGPAPANPVPVPVGGGGAGTVLTSGGGGGTTGNDWSLDNAGNANANTLTADLFREGVDGIVKAVKGAGGGGGGGGDGVDHDGIIGGNPGEGEAEAAGEAASTAVASTVTVPAVGSTSVGGSPPVFIVTFFGATIDLNPFRADRLGGVAAWFKALVAWLLVLRWAHWSTKACFEGTNVVVNAPQAKGNPVAAGTGGQATSLVAATLIMAVVTSTSIVIFAAWRDTSIGGMGVLTALTTNIFTGVSGAVAGAVWMIDQLFPLQTIVSFLFARVTFRWVVYGSAYAAVALIRFINP